MADLPADRSAEALVHCMALLKAAREILACADVGGLDRERDSVTARIAAFPLEFAEVVAALPDGGIGLLDAPTPTTATVTFTVDLAGLVPHPDDLKPHDHPLPAWMRQALFELVFNRLECGALERKLDILADGGPHKEALISHEERALALYRQATATFDLRCGAPAAAAE